MTLSIADKIVFMLSILLLAGLYWALWKSDDVAREVEILVDGKIQYILDLHENKQLIVHGASGDSVIEIRDGQARFIRSACNTRFCIRSGWQSHGGDFVACLPNNVSLHLVGGNKLYDSINF